MSFIVTQSFTFLRDIISLCRSKFPSHIMFLFSCHSREEQDPSLKPSHSVYLRLWWTRRESLEPSQALLGPWQQCDAGDRREWKQVLCRHAGAARNWT